jgi:3-oxoacyl-[acyl-carrier protein] reductase/pteridine reductase
MEDIPVKLLAGKTVLVTGGAKRIGREIALKLAEHGADVAITYLGSQAEAEQTVRDVAAFDVDALAVSCDLADTESIDATVAEVIDEFGRLMVNNAGMFESVALYVDYCRLGQMFATNTRAPFCCSRGLSAFASCPWRIVNTGHWGDYDMGDASGTTASRRRCICCRIRWRRRGRRRSA